MRSATSNHVFMQVSTVLRNNLFWGGGPKKRGGDLNQPMKSKRLTVYCAIGAPLSRRCYLQTCCRLNSDYYYQVPGNRNFIFVNFFLSCLKSDQTVVSIPLKGRHGYYIYILARRY